LCGWGCCSRLLLHSTSMAIRRVAWLVGRLRDCRLGVGWRRSLRVGVGGLRRLRVGRLGGWALGLGIWRLGGLRVSLSWLERLG